MASRIAKDGDDEGEKGNEIALYKWAIACFQRKPLQIKVNALALVG
ncbi:hypothetical protein [Coleofasciculus sp. FACHB-129]|nr:hypothetical protein [Coleofasciculus sp. FACHB-129]MBD1893248.1 hypothetical protein [Coleofasciculus sp. FACHB-129]